MAKGSSIVPVRIPNEVRAAVLAAIESANELRHDAPYTVSGWILGAIKERLDKPARRARAAAKRKTKQKGGG